MVLLSNPSYSLPFAGLFVVSCIAKEVPGHMSLNGLWCVTRPPWVSLNGLWCVTRPPCVLWVSLNGLWCVNWNYDLSQESVSKYSAAKVHISVSEEWCIPS